MFTLRSSSRFIVACLLMMALLVGTTAPQAARAATLTVNTLRDENDGSCTDGDCSLRDAIQVAAAGDTITFSVTGTIILTLGQLTIGKDLTISGPGQDSLTVSGNNSNRVFYILGGNVVISGLTIADGYIAGYGGGISNIGNLSLADIILTGNYALRDGGGMYNYYPGNSTLTNITFSSNSASDYGGGMRNYYSDSILTNVTFNGNYANYGSGGGMYDSYSNPTLTNVTFSSNFAYLDGGGMYIYYSTNNPTLTNVTFSGNSAYYYSDGGGLFNAVSNPTLTNVTFSGNSADNGGGMYSTSGSPTLTNVTFSGNSADYGGGMYNNSGRPTLTDVTFNGNSAYWGGGGMYNYYGDSILTNVTFSDNSASHGGGMEHLSGNPALTNVTFSGNFASWNGGGMDNRFGNTTLTNVTFSGNSATYGGGMYNNPGSPTLTNVTFSGNSAGNGGGMYNYSYSQPILTNVTFSSNSADYGGGIYSGYYSSPALKNTILAGNVAPTSPDCSGDVTSYGYNLIQDTTGCTIIGDATGNIYGEDPLLGPLQDNGGATLTHALLPGSPAIDAADFTDPYGNPVTEDQRGVARPQGPANDIGAYEAESLLTLHVQNIALRLRGTRINGIVAVYDQTGAPAESASVTVEITGPLPPRTLTGPTDVSGRARFAWRSRSGTWQLCVTDILKDGYTYDPTQNVETCDTITIP